MSTQGPITQEEIERFARAWFLALDQHAPFEQCAEMLASEGLSMVFPEKTLYGMGDFRAWYAGGTYSDGAQAPGVINIFFDENHTLIGADAAITGDTAEVRVLVAWQASLFEPPAAKSKRVSLDATQKWTLRRSAKNPYGLEIITYNAVAEPFVYTPGFARL